MKTLLQKNIELINSIREKSCFDVAETTRIINKFFNKVPNSVDLLAKECGFHKKRVLDMGCFYGQTLLYWGKNSEGVDASERAIRFLKILGINGYNFNVENGFNLLQDKKYEAIYCNNLIEHLVAPHLFLTRLYSILDINGILAISLPAVPSFISFLWKKFNFKGWLSVDHVNFFTLETIKLTLERAGFKVVGQYSPGLYKFSSLLSKLCVKFTPHCLLICKKYSDFKYDKIRDSKFNPSWACELNKLNK